MSKTLKLFMVLMGLHWIEHLAQAYQVWVIHMPRACAMGILGMWFPVLMTGEWLHFGFAYLTLMFLVKVAKEFAEDPGAAKWWTMTYVFSIFHFIEHSLLILQAQSHHYLFGRSVPTCLLQYFFPRIELHLFYNTVVTGLFAVALYYKLRRQHENSSPTYDSCPSSGPVIFDVDQEESGSCNCSCSGTPQSRISDRFLSSDEDIRKDRMRRPGVSGNDSEERGRVQGPGKSDRGPSGYRE